MQKNVNIQSITHNYIHLLDHIIFTKALRLDIMFEKKSYKNQN